MKAFKDRVNAFKKGLNLSISTNSEGISGAGPEDISTLNSSKLGTFNAGKRMQRRKGIQKVSDSQLCQMYEIKGHVSESVHQGMEVHFGRRLSTSEEVVIKTREKPTSFFSWQEEREWRNTMVAQLNMPKIESMCEYIALYETNDKYYVVMERVEGIDLSEHMQQGQVKQEDARQILYQMLGALEAMHASGRIHKDLKLENVVVDLTSPKMSRVSSTGSITSVEAKLIDFDTVQDWEPMSPKAKDVMGTDGYIAPESYSGDYSPASDVYAVGVIMYRLLTGKFPFRWEIFDDSPGENWVGSPAMKRIQYRLKNEKVDFARPPLNELPDAQALVRKMMAFDPIVRPSASKALKHPWFQHAGDGRPSLASCKITLGSSPVPPSALRKAGADSDSRSNGSTTKPEGSPKEEKLALLGEPEGTSTTAGRSPAPSSTLRQSATSSASSLLSWTTEPEILPREEKLVLPGELE